MEEKHSNAYLQSSVRAIKTVRFMFLNLRTKIWLTVFSIVLMFAFFVFFYFPNRQSDNLLKSYNDEVQNLANTVALGVNIALNEQNYNGIKTAMDYVTQDPALRFVSLVQEDTVWNHQAYTIQRTVMQTVPASEHPSPVVVSNDSLLVKHAPFHSTDLSGYILLGLSTKQINETKNEVRLTSLLISGVILGVGLLLGLWLARNISVPITGLRNAAKRVSEGDLSPVTIKHSKDEIGDLAKAFNKMLTDLFTAREEVNNSNKNLSETNNTLNTTLTELKATQNQLIQSEKMASLGELTAGIAHEIQNPLNFVNNFSEVSIELADELKDEISQLPVSAESKNNLISLTEDLANNQQKINYHGKRADAIVKGMLQHSRKNTGQKEPTDINVLADEYLRLSYHGLRAKDKMFNADFKTNFDESIGKINIIPQDMGRVLLNLFNNSFYAVSAKKKDINETYKPIVSVETKRQGERIVITVSDNGNGIPQRIIDKIFQPFFTTKPTGEGTGLGLSLSYDIITKEHNGTLQVDSKEGEGTRFVITLPS